jgi:L,D-peptidoglycan transpeptidase YkuD (ErfK/YbiS/YcfS/YnhG family)
VSESGIELPDGRTVPCALGRGGIQGDKREGDGVTPAGVWPIRRVLYRADRLARPRTKLPVGTIARQDGWCDAPEDAAYNQPVTLPYSASHEEMWREDGLYDLVAILGYNDDPPEPGRGSAIFLHVARPDYGPTEGCVALALPDLLMLLEQIAPDSALHIGAGAE